MPVSQTLIDLLGLSVAQLRSLAADLDVAVPAQAQQWDLALALQHVPRQRLEEHSGEFLYAGITSLSWFRLIDEEADLEEIDSPFYPLVGEEVDPQLVIDALSEDDNPFDEAVRPTEVVARPQVVAARQLGEDEFVLTFALARSRGHVIHNFDTQAVVEDQFFNVFIRPSTGVVEVRASASRARKLESTWLRDFAHRLGKQPLKVAITEQDIDDLHDRLGARLDTFKGKEAAGTSVFDTRQFSKAADVADLSVEQEFIDATASLESIGADLLFDYPDFGEVRVHVSSQNGSIFVRTAVSEAVIRHVYEALADIKS